MRLETSIEGVFACGNVLHVHDLVDFVSEEAAAAGKNAAMYVQEGESASEQGRKIKLRPLAGVRYTVPETINPMRMDEKLTVRFRGEMSTGIVILVYILMRRVLYRKRQIVAPGEMEEIKLSKEELLKYPNLDTITIKIEEA